MLCCSMFDWSCGLVRRHSVGCCYLHVHSAKVAWTVHATDMSVLSTSGCLGLGQSHTAVACSPCCWPVVSVQSAEPLLGSALWPNHWLAVPTLCVSHL